MSGELPKETQPTLTRDGKKWTVEHHKGNHHLLVEGAEMSNAVYMFHCEDSTLTIKDKINSITLDSCIKTSVVFESVVSSIEFINCRSVKMQVNGYVPTISVEKTDGCQIFLNKESLSVEIISSKSSEMNVMIPNDDSDYVECPIPEQYVSTIVGGKGLSTTALEKYVCN